MRRGGTGAGAEARRESPAPPPGPPRPRRHRPGGALAPPAARPGECAGRTPRPPPPGWEGVSFWKLRGPFRQAHTPPSQHPSPGGTWPQPTASPRPLNTAFSRMFPIIPDTLFSSLTCCGPAPPPQGTYPLSSLVSFSRERDVTGAGPPTGRVAVHLDAGFPGPRG